MTTTNPAANKMNATETLENEIRERTKEIFGAFERCDGEAFYGAFGDSMISVVNGNIDPDWPAQREKGAALFAKISSAKFEMLDMHVRALGPDSAMAITAFDYAATLEGVGAHHESSVVTWIYARENGEWKIVHSHQTTDA